MFQSSRVARLTCRATVLVATLLVPAISHAQDDGKPAGDKPQAGQPSAENLEEARVRYERGRELYADGAFAQALIEFERAYELAPTYRLLYNIGQVAFMVQDYPRAIEAFEAYLREGGDAIDETRRAPVKEELARLYGRVARITVETNVEGAEVLVDEDVVGTTPLTDPLVVNAGRHVVAVRKEGYQPAKQVVTLAGKDQIEVTLDLRQASTSNTTVPGVTYGPGVSQPDAADEGPSYVWVGWLTTGVLAAGAVATALPALAASNRADDLRETFGADPQAIEDKDSEARTLGIVTDVLIASAIVTCGITVYFTIAESSDDDSSTGNLRVDVGPTGAALRGAF